MRKRVVPSTWTRRALSPAAEATWRVSVGFVVLIPMRDPVEVTSPPETSMSDASFLVRSEALTWSGPIMLELTPLSLILKESPMS